MASVGGPIQEVSISGRTFAVAGDADATRSLGGFSNEVAANGNGSARILKTRKPWLVKGLALDCNSDRGDQEFLKGVADGTDFVPVTITFADGNTYQGKGIVADDFDYSAGKATADVTLSGPGEATKQ